MNYGHSNELAASWTLRGGLALVFLYAGVDALAQPAAWMGFIPSWASGIASASILLESASIIQILLAACLVWRPLSSYVALLMALMLLGIGFANLDALLIVFRDFGLAAAALALAALDFPYRGKNRP